VKITKTQAQSNLVLFHFRPVSHLRDSRSEQFSVRLDYFFTYTKIKKNNRETTRKYDIQGTSHFETFVP